MNSSITAGQLAAALKAVLPATKRAANFITASVLLRKEGLTASNLDCFITHQIPLPVEACLKHPDCLLRWLSHHDPNATLKIEAITESDMERIRFSVGTSHLALNTLPAEYYPALPTLQSTATVTMFAPSRAILQALYQNSADRPRAAGIPLQQMGNRIEWLASNGIRLVQAKLECLGCSSDSRFQLALPRMALRLLQQCKMGAQLEVASAGQWAVLKTGATRIIIRTEAEYPDRSKVPLNSFSTLMIERKALTRALKRCAPKEVQGSLAGFVWLVVETEGSQLMIESEIGQETLSCRLLGRSFAQDLLGVLRSVRGDEIYLQLGRGKVPTIARALNANLEYLVAGVQIACELPLPSEAAGYQRVESWRQLPEPKIHAAR